MTVLVNFGILAAIVAVIGIGGALCESEVFEEFLAGVKERVSRGAERASSALTRPLDAAERFFGGRD